MKKNLFPVSVLLLSSIFGAVPALAASALESVTVTATNGLEGLDIAKDGSIYITDALAHVVHKWHNGKLTELAKIDGAPQVILMTPRGSVLTAQQREPDFAALMQPPRDDGSNTPPRPNAPHLSASTMGSLGALLIFLDKHGHVEKTLHGKPGAFFNGIDRFGAGYLIADSAAATLWFVDPRTDSITVWLSDPLLGNPEGRFPGANGLKVVNDVVYVSNTVAGAIYSIRAAGGKPQGRLVAIAHLPFPDDFAVARDGTIFAPSAGNVIKISPDGVASTVATGCDGCDAARLTDEEHTLLLITHGFNGGSGHMYKLRLEVHQI